MKRWLFVGLAVVFLLPGSSSADVIKGFLNGANPIYYDKNEKEDKAYSALLAYYYAGNIGDVSSTLYAVRHGGEEGNPLMRPFVKAGPVPFALVKGVLSGLTVLHMKKLREKHRTAAYAIVIGYDIFYTAVVIHNVRIAKEAARADRASRRNVSVRIPLASFRW